MNTLSLTTDFGQGSPYIGVAKARLIGALGSCHIIDYTHDIERSDINEALFLLKMLLGSCPANTIHLVAVDFEERARHPEILLGVGFGQYFVGYNSGLFSMLLSEEQGFYVLGKHAGDHHHLLPNISSILPTIFSGEYKNQFPLLKKEDLVVKHSMKPVLTATNLKGNVIHVDGRGNLYTNIHLNDIEAFSLGKRFRIVLSRHEHINKMVTHAGEVEPGDTACFISDQNLLTICVNRGNASRLLGLEKGSHVLLEK